MTVQKQGKRGSDQNSRDPDFAGAEAALRRAAETLSSSCHGDDRRSRCASGRKGRLGDGRWNANS